MNNYRIFQAWAFPKVFERADSWLQQHFNQDQAGWAWSAGSSWIGSGRYPSAVYFTNPEDYLAFKIRFSEICI